MESRVGKLFEKLHSLQTHISEKKDEKLQYYFNILQILEGNIQEIKQKRDDKFAIIDDKKTELQTFINEEQLKRQKFEQQINNQLNQIDQKANKLIDKYFQDRLKEQKIQYTEIGNELTSLQEELANEASNQLRENDAYVTRIIQTELTQMRNDILAEGDQRSQIEERVFQQFFSQLRELYDYYLNEKNESEQFDKFIKESINKLSEKLQEKIVNCKQDREKSEESLLMLMENVVDKMKGELAEYMEL